VCVCVFAFGVLPGLVQQVQLGRGVWDDVPCTTRHAQCISALCTPIHTRARAHTHAPSDPDAQCNSAPPSPSAIIPLQGGAALRGMHLGATV
jgi:hypothetical protein